MKTWKKLLFLSGSFLLVNGCDGIQSWWTWGVKKLGVEKGASMVTTESGLQYEILKAGDTTSKTPEKGDMVTVHYTGWLNKDGKPGTQFDSSHSRKAPFEFAIGVKMVIAGWDEGVASMHIGEQRRLFIPAKLGYGARGVPGVIPPSSDLIFDVELLAIGE